MSRIAIENLEKTYPGSAQPAVGGVTLTVEPGEVFGLLGPNGAGKSTIIGVCTTRVIPSAGHVRIGPIDIVADPVGAKRRIGIMPQYSTLDRSVSVWENLYLHCRYFGLAAPAARARSDELLGLFSLAGHREDLIPTLSGGQARRLQLARALAHRPSVVFLDEPTVGLDPQSRHLLWTLIASLRDDKVAVLVTTHYMEEADTICDRLAIIDHGLVIAEGTPAELKARLGADAVISVSVSSDASALIKALLNLKPVASVSEEPKGHLRVLVNGDDSAAAAVAQAAVPFGLTEVSVEPTSLETVFIALTGRQLRD